MSLSNLRIVVVLVLILFAHKGFSQKYVPSRSYRVLNASYEKVNKYAQKYDASMKPYQTKLVSMSNSNDVVMPISIVWPETFDSCFVEELTDHNLKHVGKILKVQIEFAACCYNITTHYILITKVGDVIELPQIEYVMCDWPCDIDTYDFGKDGKTIRKVTNHHGVSGEITSRTYHETLIWNGHKLK